MRMKRLALDLFAFERTTPLTATVLRWPAPTPWLLNHWATKRAVLSRRLHCPAGFPKNIDGLHQFRKSHLFLQSTSCKKARDPPKRSAPTQVIRQGHSCKTCAGAALTRLPRLVRKK